MIDMRVCISCRQEKPSTNEFFFYRNKARGWLSSWCKVCRKANREKTFPAELAAQRERRGLTPCRSCGTDDKDKGSTYCNACFAAKKREAKRAEKPIQRSRLRKATPKWADKNKIKEIYASRKEGMHVDHIIPIRGELVCGLHVETNLQVIPAWQNMSKSNHYSLEHEGKK